MRALPLLLLAGGGLLALLASRRASAAPLPIVGTDEYEPAWQQPASRLWGDIDPYGPPDPASQMPMFDWPEILPAEWPVFDPTPADAFDYLDALDFDNPALYPADAPSTGYVDMTGEQSTANINAFLWMIRVAEGTADDRGFNTMFGYRYFDSFADHPRAPMQFTDAQGRRLWSSAAGAFQIVAVSPIPGGGSTRVDTWDRMQRKLGLPDFTPASQTAAAIELIREEGALDDVRAGRFGDAVYKVRRVWASLPGAGYDQPERKFDELQTAYLNAGGALA